LSISAGRSFRKPVQSRRPGGCHNDTFSRQSARSGVRLAAGLRWQWKVAVR